MNEGIIFIAEGRSVTHSNAIVICPSGYLGEAPEAVAKKGWNDGRAVS